MTIADQQLRVDSKVDSLEAVTKLASSGLFSEYVVYERPDDCVFAAGVIGRIQLDTNEIRTMWNGESWRKEWSGSPAAVLDEAFATLPTEDTNAYGWIGFEFCAYSHGAAARLGHAQPLAHLIVPRIEVRFTDGGFTIVGGDATEQRSVFDLLATEPARVPATGTIDIRTDPTAYCERVASAVAEIEQDLYQKVIISRRVDIDFEVDMAATYRLARPHNNPSRSFLLRLGGVEVAGFSPEIVASVDSAGCVTSEPLAGTRAFGRGSELDLAARTDLESDPKEIVEHAVSVRTSLAEIQTVTEPGTAVVSDFMEVVERGSVQHLASTVRGQLSPCRSHWDAFDALFPSVTASGIPKEPSIDAIFRLDGPARGLYSGAVVALTTGHSLDAALVLRAIYQEDGQAWLRSGAGIIAQSVPDREFEETCEKLGSIAKYVVRRTNASATGQDRP